ncbi:MAG: cation diffusion facilitator family transporter [Candidatus Omnitrophica bacterium]|nr:cation diffusion facilitator family transporter [Candidatus Omnitrophota bacterium]MBU4589956.1 cation diffusion facilitator family transporter [Candidatus Omnitrophota bacterium]
MDKFVKIRRILVLILALNWFVAFSKIIYGLITKCASMTADGVHSFGDGASNIIGLVGIWAASKPRDADHPYGHKKFETFATLGIAVILFLAAIEILREAISRVFHPVSPDVTFFSFALMFVTLLINVAVMKYERKKGKDLSSDILICDALHTRSDIFASLAVIGTLVSIKIGFSFLDVIVAGLIAVLIAKSGLQILKASSDVLCDASVLERTKIANIVKEIPGVRSVHKIRTRGRKDDIHVDLHVTIDANMSVDDAHDISHKIEKSLKKNIPGITDVIVHVEPSQ